MPKKHQKTVTLKDVVYFKAEDKAKKLKTSVAAYISGLILSDLKEAKTE